MIHIWLCDDECMFLKAAETVLSVVLDEKNIAYTIRSFTHASSLFDALSFEKPDLLLLDLVLDNEDGFDIAERIRQLGIDTEIVFITNYPDKMGEAFIYRPIGFLAKPITQEALAPIIERFLFFYQQKNFTYMVSTRTTDLRIPIRYILYFESKSHKIRLFVSTQPDLIEYVGKLDDIERELSAFHFARNHKSFLVNTHVIAALDRRQMTILLKNGNTLPISRRCYASLNDKFVQDRIR